MDSDDLSWQVYTFDQLTTDTLYRLLQLRSEVFVVEQDIVYQDLDDVDRVALHLLGFLQEHLICYARILPPGCRYPGAAIGRIITGQSYRGKGYGSQLVMQAIACSRQNWPDTTINISAQLHLQEFYSQLGFQAVGAPYDEEEILHIKMVQE